MRLIGQHTEWSRRCRLREHQLLQKRLSRQDSFCRDVFCLQERGSLVYPVIIE